MEAWIGRREAGWVSHLLRLVGRGMGSPVAAGLLLRRGRDETYQLNDWKVEWMLRGRVNRTDALVG